MGNDTNRTDDTNDDDPATAEGVRKLGRRFLDRGKQKAKELGSEAQQRLEAYQQNPKLLERDLEDLAAEGSELGQAAKERIRSVGGSAGDGAARQLGWRDATEMVQAYGADSPVVEAYLDAAPADLQAASERFDFARFDGSEFVPFQNAAGTSRVADPLGYAVSARSEAYLRQHGVEADGVFVEYTTDAATLDDINEETAVQVDFYTVE